MQEHEKFLRLASKYLDRELTGRERSEFKHHLKHCDICQGEIEVVNRLKQDMKKSLTTSVSAQKAESILKVAQNSRDSFNLANWIRETGLLFPVPVQLVIQIILLILGIEIGISYYKSGQQYISSKVSITPAVGYSGLFDAVYPGSMAESFIKMEAHDE